MVTLTTVTEVETIGSVVTFGMTTSSPDAGAPLGLQLPAVAQAVVNAPVQVFVVAAVYGPTSGPPLPFGAAPAGSTNRGVSAMARARLSRPLPVSVAVPAASAVRARRETMTPLGQTDPPREERGRGGHDGRRSGRAGDQVVPPPTAVVTMSVPGAPRKASAPKFDDVLSASFGRCSRRR